MENEKKKDDIAITVVDNYTNRAEIEMQDAKKQYDTALTVCRILRQLQLAVKKEIDTAKTDHNERT